MRLIAMLSIVLAAAFPVAVGAHETAAAGACPHVPAILSLSQTILDGRRELGRFEQRRFGAEAAYFAIRYGGMDDAAAEALLAGLAGEDIRELGDVAFAWHVAHGGADGAAQKLGAAAFADAVLGSPTAVRALVVEGEGGVVLNALATLDAGQRATRYGMIATALLDRSDAEKTAFATLAEQTGEPLLAGHVLATLRDQTELRAFLERTDETTRDRVIGVAGWLPPFVGNPPLLDKPKNDPETWSKIWEIAAVASIEPQLDYLNIFLNQTGLVDEAHGAAVALRDAIMSGAVDQKGTFDAAWMVVYRALRETVDGEVLLSMLRSVDVSTGRQARNRLAGELDWIIAVEALGPYLRGETAALPEAPPATSGAPMPDWSEWLRIAATIRESGAVIPPPDALPALAIAADLLFSIGLSDSLAALVADAPPEEGVPLAADFIKRLDRACADYLWHTSEGYALGGMAMWKFDDPPAAADPPGPPGPPPG